MFTHVGWPLHVWGQRRRGQWTQLVLVPDVRVCKVGHGRWCGSVTFPGALNFVFLEHTEHLLQGVVVLEQRDLALVQLLLSLLSYYLQTTTEKLFRT